MVKPEIVDLKQLERSMRHYTDDELKSIGAMVWVEMFERDIKKGENNAQE